jgi:hypothetical protein
MNRKDTTCSQCGKKLILSRDNNYIRCEDLSCPSLIPNICRECNKGKYINSVASHGYYQGVPFFQCNQCNSIFNNKS